ncbi:fasciclin-like arabinogalactan protein 3 [Brachypodium distachyon]|uniref:FAS1 domain-containing protein n=1 Tax=Brachypodium distachyon TaxID=15368 RepID=A0A0Q3H1U6_BRADI|nr:fasciclin-like arabinogalactan protein 3 [Brachypodium distachyon]KQK16903.2 hypothetical protein BRADI_1g31333v3 [Brachypodium distachyon]|eukprot:XP_003560388.1 fasciclin-like arabinogalactan protein 3 [Brachypodium distachyon]
MAPPKLSLLALLFLLFPAAGNAAAAAAAADPADTVAAAAPPALFNVTEILGRFPDFTLFNYLLTKTKVSAQINRRGTVTILAPVNADVDWLLRRSSRLPRAALVELLAVHVILDYIDAAKLAALPRGRPGAPPVVATTLYQTMGVAPAGDRSGFLTITPTGNGGAVFASAAPGALVNAPFKKAVTAKPYNISVLQISNFVVPPGVISRPRFGPPPPRRIRSMAVAPSPAPAPVLPAVPPVTMPVEEGTTETIPVAAPEPSDGNRAVEAMRLWFGAGVVMALACVLVTGL